MRIVHMTTLFLLLSVCCGCDDVAKISKGFRQAMAAFFSVIEIGNPRLFHRGPPHARLKMEAENYFTDPDMIAFCHALERKDIAEMERLLRNGLDINAIGKKKAKGNGEMTLTRWSLPMGEDIFKWMLLHGADPWYEQELSKDGYMSSAALLMAKLDPMDLLQRACHDVDFTHYLKLMLDLGPPPPPGELDRLLAETVSGGGGDNFVERVQWLVDAGADVNTTKHGVAIIFEARAPSIMLILLKAGADWQLNGGKDGTRGEDVVLKLARMLVPFGQNHEEFARYDAERRKLYEQDPAFHELCRWLKQRGANVELAVEKLRETRSGVALERWRVGKELPYPPNAPQVIGNPFDPVTGNVIYPSYIPREERTWLPPIQAPAGP